MAFYAVITPKQRLIDLEPQMAAGSGADDGWNFDPILADSALAAH